MKEITIVALSGGVDSAVAALLLRDAGHAVECLHMTNWEDDGYCDNAREFQDARRVCEQLDLPLHRVSFAAEYREQVFAHFLSELEAGRTPNPDVLCNREIKFGVLGQHARRLGANRLATGHYARLDHSSPATRLLKAVDAGKDQTYFLHAVDPARLDNVVFPVGTLTKSEVRHIARDAGLDVATKRDSTGICFIGERPFPEFVQHYLPTQPGPIETPDGERLGTHRGLAFYTLGQRHGLAIGGRKAHRDAPWYVAEKRTTENVLVVVQGESHPALLSDWLIADESHWISPHARDRCRAGFACSAKTRYRQADQACHLRARADGMLEVRFDAPQRAVTPGQYVVFYDGEECLGGATIERAELLSDGHRATAVGTHRNERNMRPAPA